MKRIFTLIVLVAAGLTAAAQPTITSSDLPTAGYGWVTANDSTFSDPIPAGGANATWNYTGLTFQTTDTSIFLAAAGTPYSSQFPSSNLANYSGGTWAYFTTNSTGFYLDGAYDSAFGGAVNYTPPLLGTPVPFTYQDTRTANAAVQVDFNSGGTNLRINIASALTFLGDGWGSLALPNGTFNNVLRIKTTNLSTNTISADLLGIGVYTPLSTSQSQTTDFQYFQHGAAQSLLLDIQADSLGQFATSSGYYLSNSVGINPVAGRVNAVSYPNPSTSYVSIPKMIPTDATSIEVTSLDGRMVTLPVNNLSDRVVLSTDVLANGVYTFRLGAMSGRFTVQH